MKHISPITLKSRKILILKTIAEIKKEENYKDNLFYINKKIDTLKKELINNNSCVHHRILEEELELYLKYKSIICIKIDENFIEGVMQLENKFVNTKTLKLFVLSYIAIEHIKIENIYQIESKQIKNTSLENEPNFSLLKKDNFLTDFQYRDLLNKYELNSNVLSKFKQSLAFYFYKFFYYTKEDSEHAARHISKSLFNDDKGVNSTREELPPIYKGKYIQFL
jgi:mannitol-specific phosphotransferase system IIBC component